MERAVRITRQENDREKTEYAAKHSFQPVMRMAVPPLCVLYFYFAQPESAIACQHRYVAMSLAVDQHFIQHLSAITLQPAVDVVQPYARQERRCAIVNLRAYSLRQS